MLTKQNAILHSVGSRQPQERGVSGLVEETCARVRPWRHTQGEAPAGLPVAESAPDSRVHVSPDARLHTDGEHLAIVHIGPFEGLGGFAPRREQMLGLWQEYRAGMAEGHPSRIAGQQRHAQSALKLPDLLAQRRLGDVESLRRSREAELLRNRYEVAEVTQMNIHNQRLYH